MCETGDIFESAAQLKPFPKVYVTAEDSRVPVIVTHSCFDVYYNKKRPASIKLFKNRQEKINKALSYIKSLRPMQQLHNERDKKHYKFVMITLKCNNPEDYPKFLQQFKEETGQDYETLPTWSQLNKQSKNAATPGKEKMHANNREFPEGNMDARIVSGTPGKEKMHIDQQEFPEGSTDEPVVSETKKEVLVENVSKA